LYPELIANESAIQASAEHIAQFFISRPDPVRPTKREANTMNHIALKMLMGDKGKYIGIIMGLTLPH